MLLVLALVVPVLAILGTRHVPLLDRLSPIVVCYGVGIVLANVGASDADTADLVTAATVALAIPLLLVGTDFRAWLANARPTIVSFALAIATIVVVAPLMATLFGDLGAPSGDIAGMTIGVYTGGTANMAAIQQAVGVDEATFIALNAADIVASSVYLLFLLSPATALLWRFLPRTPRLGVIEEEEAHDEPTDDFDPAPSAVDVGRSLALAIGMVLVGAGLGYTVVALLTDTEAILDSEAFGTAAVLGVTSAGIAASFVPRLRNQEGTYAVGQYLFLVFAVAIGSLADLGELADSFTQVFPFIATTLVVAIGLHLVLAWVFRLDRDTVLITSTAAVFGPPFVGPVAGALGNREVVIAGMTTGVVGLALGNYLGLAVARLFA